MDFGSFELNAHMSWFDFLVVAVYLAFMLLIGWVISRKMPNFNEFFIAGRTMTTPILICTLVSTYYGVDVLFGTSELAYNEGVVAWFGYSRPTYLFFIIAAFLLTRKLREHNYRSLPDILQFYYGKKAGVFGAMASFVYSLPSLGLFGLGMVFKVVFPGPSHLIATHLHMEPQKFGAILFGGVALVYTLWGGLWAVAVTDTVQFVLMCVTLSIAIPLVMGHVGGFDYIAHNLPASFFHAGGDVPIWLIIIYGATGLTILVDPAFYQRIFAARNFKMVRNALLIGILMWSAYDWLVTAGGILAAGAVHAGLLPADTHPNAALLRVVIFALPAGLTGLFLAGVLSAAMSTIDSYCLVAGGNVVYDIYRPVFNPRASDEQLIRLTKWGVLLSWVLGYVLAFYFERLLALWVFMSTLLTSTVIVPIMVGLYYKGRKTKMAGLLSCAFGFVAAISYYVLLHRLGSQNEEYGTFIWTFSLFGRSISLWQEYALFFSVPLSAVGFILGSIFGREIHQPEPDAETVSV
ncbi:MAG TPA: sodium:solute symporter family protein [Candidatus Polarisedimenticolia bacterium]|nr:sodium:solute symporter family protein [Candidatus Polarisedimenticolia bacterium]